MQRFLAVASWVLLSACGQAGDRDGGVIRDPSTPRLLLSEDVYIAGAGDPEDFFYRGERLADGTRRGDQDALIASLARQSVNGLYVQVIRSHGGDGLPDHNPFIDNQPDKGLSDPVLSQWEEWLAELERHGVQVLFFIYDDESRIWETGDLVGREEREFVHSIVDRFERFSNIIWAVAEEYSESLSPLRASRIAAEIAAADDHSHPIAVHKLVSTEFYEFANDENIGVFAMQWDESGPAGLNRAVTKAWTESAGRYSVIMSEAPGWGTGLTAQRNAWPSAFAGAHVRV